MTVFDNIAFPLRMRGSDAKSVTDAVRAVLDLVQLPDLGSRYSHQLSGGQQQRVALARALVFEPKVLLMDEPLGALDKNLREQLQHELRRLHGRLGVTVVYVTHDQQEALVMSDRIALVNHGRLIQVGSGRELYERPKSEFVAQFLGESNILEGIVERLTGPIVQVSVDGALINAPAVTSVGVGQSVRLLLRPERIRILAVEETAFPATVEEVTYLGDSVRALVRLTPGPKLVMKASSRLPIPEEGGNLRVGWDIDDLSVVGTVFGVELPRAGGAG